MGEACDTKSLANLFTKGSHHRNVTILYHVQNMFDQGNSSRTVRLNSHYIVVFRNLRDQSQFRTMAAQILPNNSQWLMDAYADATAKSYGYLVIDNSPHCDPIFRFRKKFSVEICPRCIAIERPCIKDRDHRLQIRLNRRTDEPIKIDKGP